MSRELLGVIYREKRGHIRLYVKIDSDFTTNVEFRENGRYTFLSIASRTICHPPTVYSRGGFLEQTQGKSKRQVEVRGRPTRYHGPSEVPGQRGSHRQGGGGRGETEPRTAGATRDPEGRGRERPRTNGCHRVPRGTETEGERQRPRTDNV